ncbi:MAG TPA: hypothetical protein VFS60_17905 [Thermoanaerobaculia bacterium]|nr:hypothetical protein [Thermoanaerobaculia bacterium]
MTATARIRMLRQILFFLEGNGMKSATSVVVRAVCLSGLGSLLTVGGALAAPAQGSGGSGPINVPTLGGVGLAALAGALSIGGAWLLRQRDKDK